MSDLGVMEPIDPLNFAIVRLQPFFNDTQLGNATDFFIVASKTAS